MLVKSVQSAVIADGMISLIIGQSIELPDEVAERLIDAGIVEAVKVPKRDAKKVTAAPENKAVGQDAGHGS